MPVDMKLTHIHWVALFASVVCGSCSPGGDQQQALECSKSEEVRELCCDDPEGEPVCETACYRSCSEDLDCATDMMLSCQNGVCVDLLSGCSI